MKLLTFLNNVNIGISWLVGARPYKVATHSDVIDT